jgi:hypothetical protein
MFIIPASNRTDSNDPTTAFRQPHKIRLPDAHPRASQPQTSPQDLVYHHGHREECHRQ